jgi:hypothetical protein
MSAPASTEALQSKERARAARGGVPFAVVTPGEGC